MDHIPGDQVNEYYFSDFVFAAPADTHRPGNYW